MKFSAWTTFLIFDNKLFFDFFLGPKNFENLVGRKKMLIDSSGWRKVFELRFENIFIVIENEKSGSMGETLVYQCASEEIIVNNVLLVIDEFHDSVAKFEKKFNRGERCCVKR